MASSTLTSTDLQFLNASSALIAKIAGDDTNNIIKLSGQGNADIRLSGLATPQDPTDAVNRQYVDGIGSGLHWMESVKVASTANIDLASFDNSQNIDGPVALTEGDRVLLKDQSPTGAENGIYEIQADGTLQRAEDMAQDSDPSGRAVFVREGTVNSDKGFVCITDNVLVGGGAISFTQFTSSGTINAGTGLEQVGDDFNVKVDNSTIEIDGVSDTLRVKDAGLANSKLQNSEITLQSPADGGLTGTALGNIALGETKILSVDSSVVRTDQSLAVTITDQTEANSATEGCLILSGGLGVSKNVHVGQDVTVIGSSSAASHNATSDERFKKNIKDLDDTAAIQSLRPVSYEWKNSDVDRYTHLGFIAQEVQKVLPEVVRENAKGEYSLEYSSIFTLLLKSHQQLELRVRQLEAKMNA